jgi:hypothetical protein
MKRAFTTLVEISDDDIANLLCSAFEGGSNYWYRIIKFNKPKGKVWAGEDGDMAEFAHISYPLSPGGSLIIAVEGDEAKAGLKYRLSRKQLQSGLDAMRLRCPHHFANVINNNADAITGDVFLQCCLFGEAIYG